jgi:hypothetical protein
MDIKFLNKTLLFIITIIIIIIIIIILAFFCMSHLLLVTDILFNHPHIQGLAYR